MYTISAAIFSAFLTLPIPPVESADTGIDAVRIAQVEQEVTPAPERSAVASRIPAFWIILPD